MVAGVLYASAEDRLSGATCGTLQICGCLDLTLHFDAEAGHYDSVKCQITRGTWEDVKDEQGVIGDQGV